MHDRILDYLAGALETDESQHIEQMLAANGDAQQTMEVLKLSFAPLEGDRGHVDAPHGLAKRTCLHIRVSKSNRPE